MPSKLIIVINIILDYVQRISYRNVRVQGSDIRWYHCFFIFNENISEVVGKRDGVISVVVFIFGISFQNVSFVFVGKTVEWGDTTGRIGTSGLSIFGWL